MVSTLETSKKVIKTDLESLGGKTDQRIEDITMKESEKGKANTLT